MIQILAPIDHSIYGIVEYMLSSLFLCGIIIIQVFPYLFNYDNLQNMSEALYIKIGAAGVKRHYMKSKTFLVSLFLHYVFNGVLFSVIEKPKLLLVLAMSLNFIFVVFKIWMIKVYISILIGVLTIFKDACFIAYLAAFYVYLDQPSIFLEIFVVSCFGLAFFLNLIEIIWSIVTSIKDYCLKKK